MTVQTAQTYGGDTRVTIHFGVHPVTILFRNRHDAAVFLQALRKRIR